MTVASTTSASQATSNLASTGATKSLGKDEFLKLLTAQLKAQDPMNPMDSTNFTAQLAQFSSLEQMTNMNASLTNMLASQNSLQNTMAMSFIGKKVSFDGNAIKLNGQASLRYSLAGDSASVMVSISDSKGALVRRDVLTNQPAGANTYAWNGRDQYGNLLPAGDYHYTVDAANSSGQTVIASPLSSGTVTGISYDNNSMYLNIDGTTRIQLSDIKEIQGGN
jgi:flagellar basal-body rod modification protein FlgD